MKPIVKLISQKTGYSASTVSNALSGKRSVSTAARSKILSAAKEEGFISRPVLLRIKFVVFRNNGLIVDSTPYFQQLLQGVEEECRKNGIELRVVNIDKRQPDYEAQYRWLQQEADTGLIILGNEMMDEDSPFLAGIRRPFIVIDYYREDAAFHCLESSNTASSMVAVEYLVEKGHRNIGYIRGSMRIKPFRERFAGYQLALQKYSIPLAKQNIITVDTTMDGACAGIRKYLASNPSLPTAFFAENDTIALGAMRAFTECGYRIPGDVSFIGYDDLPYSAISSPPLTTIRVQKEAMGRYAVCWLMQINRDDTMPKLHVEMRADFIERKSVACLS